MHEQMITSTTRRHRSVTRRVVAAAAAAAAALLLASCTVKIGDSGSDDAKATTTTAAETTTTAAGSSGVTEGATTADISGLVLPGYTLALDGQRTEELKANPSIQLVANDVQVNSVSKDGAVVGGIITLALKTKDVDEDTVRDYAEGVAGEGGKVENVGRNDNVIVATVSSENGLSHTIYISDNTGLLVDVYSGDAATTQSIVEAIASGG